MAHARCAVLLLASCLVACGRSDSGERPPAAGTPAAAAPASDTIHAAPTEPDSADAIAVIHAYYGAINDRRYDDAYRLWSGSGRSSGKSLQAFRGGFAGTSSVSVVTSSPAPIGAAAGSRYIEIPVRIAAVMADGSHQSFAGTYTLRRSVVDGATPEQRAWRIYSARIRRARS